MDFSPQSKLNKQIEDRWDELNRYYNALQTLSPPATHHEMHSVVHIYLFFARVHAVQAVHTIEMESVILFVGEPATENPWEEAVVSARRVVEFIDLFCLQKNNVRPQPVSCVALAALARLEKSRDYFFNLARKGWSKSGTMAQSTKDRAQFMVRAVVAERSNDVYLRDLCISKSENWHRHDEGNSSHRLNFDNDLSSLCKKVPRPPASLPVNFAAAINVCKRLDLIRQLDLLNGQRLDSLLSAYIRCVFLAEKRTAELKVWQADTLMQLVLLHRKVGDIQFMSNFETNLDVVECACTCIVGADLVLPEHTQSKVQDLLRRLWERYFNTCSAEDNYVPECVRCAAQLTKVSYSMCKLS